MVVGATLGVVAFGSAAPSGAASSPAPSACTLLAAPEVQAAFGGTVADGSLTTAPDGTQSFCNWVVILSSSQGYGVQLDVYSGRPAATFASQRKIAGGRTRTVRHLGDGAFSERAVVAGHVLNDLWVRHATINFRVEIPKDLGSMPLEPLARLVLSRL
jgi:hypothetical protein